MVENVLFLFIYIVLLIGLVYLGIYVLGKMQVTIPPMLMNFVWVLVLLIILVLAWRAFSPFIGGSGRLFPR